MQQLVIAGAPEGMRMVEDMMNGSDARLAQQAVWMVVNQGTPDAKRIVDKALQSKDAGVRMAAIQSLAQSPDERATQQLLALTKDADPQIRQIALQSLGQVGSEQAQQAILDATHSDKPDDRIAALNGLAAMDDARASAQIATMMRDPDPSVAQMAVSMSYNGGPEVDQALTQIVDDPSAEANLRQIAANQLRGRGAELDDATEKQVAALAGPARMYGGYGYGGVGD
jgi:HEAT repeat protein